VNTLHAAFLGLIQGLTEFFPVSSSGHLILGSALLGLPAPGLSFSIMVHLGTAFATVVMLWREIAWLVSGVFAREEPEGRGGPGRRPVRRSRALWVIWFLVVASVPGALVGVWGSDLIEKAFSSAWVASAGLIVTGLVLWRSRGAGSGRAGERAGAVLDTVSLRPALYAGLAQAVAIVPGVSRSGMTITTGLLSGLSREDAARFSFLLSLPAVFGAAILDYRKGAVWGEPLLSGPALAGACVAFAAGVLAIRAVLRVVRKGELSNFAYYCWTAGAVSLAWLIARG
jgi:undecaprenyl-diphosphatase